MPTLFNATLGISTSLQTQFWLRELKVSKKERGMLGGDRVSSGPAS